MSKFFKIDLTVYKLYFVIKVRDKKLSHIIEVVISNLLTYTFVYNPSLKRLIRQRDKGYYVYDVKRDEYRFPISIAKDVLILLGQAGLNKEYINLIIGDHREVSIDMDWNKDIVLRDYQEDYVNAILNNNLKSIFLIDLFTGGGKTALLCNVLYRFKLRVGILVLPKYIEKWIEDIKKYLLATDDDIYVIQGSESLIELMEEEDISYKYIIFSLRTVGNYISDYQSGNDDAYPIKPDELFQHLGIGIFANDETHQHFHAVSQAMLYFNALKFIGSSATFDSNQKDIKKIYDMIIPESSRVSNLIQYQPYTYGKAVMYRLQMSKHIKYKRQQGYNHILFEQSILRNSVLLSGYLDMVCKYIEEGYLNRRKAGDKLLVFFASIEMCTRATLYFKEKYNSISNLNINRYVEDDPYESVLTSDISVTTHLSAGTAFDIPNLITVIQTVSMRSLQANLQNFGRLRKLKDRETWYYWLYTRDISNQRSMHNERLETLTPKMLHYEELHYPKELKSY